MRPGTLRSPTSRPPRASHLTGRGALRLLALPALLGCLVACTERPAPEQPAPNILLLVIDCLRADRLARTDLYDRDLAPHLHRLAAEGVVFDNAFAQASWTRPSIPTLLTGLYPAEHGLGDFAESDEAVTGGHLSAAAVTLAEVMKALGYDTAMIGEQHQLSPRFGLDQGFDLYNHKGAKAASIHHGFFTWLDGRAAAANGGTPTAAPATGSSSPFFAYLHYLELHWPYCPPEDVRGTLTPGYQGREFCYQWRQLRDDLRSGEVVLSAEEIVAMRARYDEELMALDGDLGELFAGLEQRSLWRDTLVVVTADHGEEFFEHGGMGHGNTLHDELTAVPLVFRLPAGWPGPRGERLDGLVELRDVMPTLIAAAGARPGEELGGVDLLPWLLGERHGSPRTHVVSEHAKWVAVRDARHKLIAWREGNRQDLYDLASDPGELSPIEDGAAATELRGRLREWQRALRPLPSEATELDEETAEGLRALGYLGD